MLTFQALHTSSKSAPKGEILLDFVAQESDNELSFEDFLRSLSAKTKPSDAQNTLLDAQVTEEKHLKKELGTLEELQALLIHDEKTLPNTKSASTIQTQTPTTLQKESKENSFGLHKEISNTLSLNELKYLLSKAKHYLSKKITQLNHTQHDKQSDNIPKTLKGVLQTAQKLDIEVTKITYETLKEESATETTSHQTQTEKRISQKMQPLRGIPLFTQKSTIAVSTKEFIETKNATLHVKTPNKQTKQHDNSHHLQRLLRSTNEEKQTNSQTIQPVASFRAKTSSLENQKILHVTQNIKPNQETMQKTDMQNLEQLLRTEETHSTSSTHIKSSDSLDVKMNEAKQMMRTEETPSTSSTHIKSSDSLDVKMHEAKQMMRYLGEDIKRAIDDYKPPFTRVSLKLNPRHLGELAMTVVQRGKKVHVNLSSNNAALNLLVNNLPELKVQLNQNGIQNASFSFNASTSQEQNQKERHKEEHSKAYFVKQDEENEESLHSLEIIIPRYI